VDRVWGTDTSLSTMYQELGRPLLDVFWRGRSATLIIVGAGHTGRNYLLFGQPLPTPTHITPTHASTTPTAAASQQGHGHGHTSSGRPLTARSRSRQSSINGVIPSAPSQVNRGTNSNNQRRHHRPLSASGITVNTSSVGVESPRNNSVISLTLPSSMIATLPTTPPSLSLASTPTTPSHHHNVIPYPPSSTRSTNHWSSSSSPKSNAFINSVVPASPSASNTPIHAVTSSSTSHHRHSGGNSGHRLHTPRGSHDFTSGNTTLGGSGSGGHIRRRSGSHTLLDMDANYGLVYRIIDDLFERTKDGGSVQYSIWITYLDVYDNDVCQDLIHTQGIFESVPVTLTPTGPTINPTPRRLQSCAQLREWITHAHALGALSNPVLTILLKARSRTTGKPVST
jgi:hypothetical protein